MGIRTNSRGPATRRSRSLAKAGSDREAVSYIRFNLVGVKKVEGAVFGVNIIPHTWDNTSLAGAGVGSHVNIEVDVIARYVARLLEQD